MKYRQGRVSNYLAGVTIFKKLLLPICAAALFASCGKDGTTIPGNNTWTVGTHAYKAVLIHDTIASGLYALEVATGSDSTAHHLLISFYGVSLPVSGGIYAVVPVPQGSNQLSVLAYNYDTLSHTTTAYLVNAAGSLPTFAVLAIDAGKITLNLQEAEAVNTSNTTDSVQLSIHNLTQQ